MKQIALLCTAFATALAWSAPIQAHHSFAAEYDGSDVVKVSGAVTKIEWRNPHVYFYVDVLNKQTGKVDNWAWEMGAPAVIQRQGWRRNSMKVGDLVTVQGAHARDGSTRGFARSVVFTLTGVKLGSKPSYK